MEAVQQCKLLSSLRKLSTLGWQTSLTLARPWAHMLSFCGLQTHKPRATYFPQLLRKGLRAQLDIQADPLPSPIHGLSWAESPTTHGLCQEG